MGDKYGTLVNGEFTVTVPEDVYKDVPIVLDFNALVTDGDGDTVSTQTFTVTLDGDATLTGGDGSDVIVGSNASETLIGGEGDDTLIGGGGADVIDGGDGTDTVSYTGSDSRSDR